MVNERSTSRLGQYKCLPCHNWISLICWTVAFLNQGNCSNGRKYSLPLKNIQKPCSEMFVISGFKVLLPRFDDFTSVFLDYFLQPHKLRLRKTRICYQGHYRLYPEFCLTLRRNNVDMNSFFFPRKEVKSVTSNPKNCRAHKRSIKQSWYIVNQTFSAKEKAEWNWLTAWRDRLRKNAKNFEFSRNIGRNLLPPVHIFV